MNTNTNTTINTTTTAELDAQLVSASEDGDTELVRGLLAAGADPDTWGNMPLGSAAYHGHVAVVKLLLDAGADVHAMDDLMDAVDDEVAKILADWANK